MKSPKSKSMNVDLTAQSHELPKKKESAVYFSGETQNTVVYHITYWEWQRFMALVRKHSNWD